MLLRPSRPDIVDRAAGLTDGGTGLGLRTHRPEIVSGVEACRLSVLAPEDDLGLSRGFRAAVARRVALHSEHAALISEYPASEEPGLREVSHGGMPDDPRLAAVAAHVDMIAREPARASRAALQALLDVGMSPAQIVALSELVAFVCFQVQVVEGLAAVNGAR